MISDKLKKITLISLVMIYAHGLEEIIFGFWKVNSVLSGFYNQFSSIPQAAYYASHIPWWLFLVPLFLLVLGGKWTLRVMALFGLVFIIEIHHILGGLTPLSYYPGLITAIFYPIVGFFYWKEWIKNFRDQNGRKSKRKN
ncbi:hypothetical protein HQ489_02125 [Candidatus Woesearchaeota archaeon]|nr:hypothetical protein [Candidatus Woesearchaeota archaeon]